MAGNFPHNQPHHGQHRMPRGHFQAGSFAGQGRRGLMKIARQPVTNPATAGPARRDLARSNPDFAGFARHDIFDSGDITPTVGDGGIRHDIPGGVGGGGILPEITVELLEHDVGLRATSNQVSSDLHHIMEKLRAFAKERARAYAPVGKTSLKPGNLRASIDAGPVTGAGGYLTFDLTADAVYARGVEEGTPDQHGTPGNLIGIHKMGEKPKGVWFRKGTEGVWFMRRAYEETDALAEAEIQKLRFDK